MSKKLVDQRWSHAPAQSFSDAMVEATNFSWSFDPNGGDQELSILRRELDATRRMLGRVLELVNKLGVSDEDVSDVFNAEGYSNFKLVEGE